MCSVSGKKKIKIEKEKFTFLDNLKEFDKLLAYLTFQSQKSSYLLSSGDKTKTDREMDKMKEIKRFSWSKMLRATYHQDSRDTDCHHKENGVSLSLRVIICQLLLGILYFITASQKWWRLRWRTCESCEKLCNFERVLYLCVLN